MGTALPERCEHGVRWRCGLCELDEQKRKEECAMGWSLREMTDQERKEAQQAARATQEFAGAEADPQGLDPKTQGAKLDAGKVDLTFLMDYFPRALTAVCWVSEFGASKYSRGGWRGVPDGVSRYTKALLRHLFGVGRADPIPNLDPKDVHDAQVAWNALARLELKLKLTGNG